MTDEIDVTFNCLEKHEFLSGVFVLQPEGRNPTHTWMLLKETHAEKIRIHTLVKDTFIKF